ncbi:MAG: SLOG family protein [Acidobacteriaceae bacterium]|nr:SLOG family protein [Acidobacteriaceae bacterium]
MSDTNNVPVAVIGSRRYPRLDLVDAAVASLAPGVVIISGGAEGVDHQAEEAARQCGLPIRVFPADWKNQGRKAGPLRNAQIVAAAGRVLAFWDGISRGTLNTVVLSVQAGKPVQIVGPNGETIALNTVLAAAESLGVIAALPGEAGLSPEEVLIDAVLRRCAFGSGRDNIDAIIAHFGTAKILHRMHHLDTLASAEGWARVSKSNHKTLERGEFVRENAILAIARAGGDVRADGMLAAVPCEEGYAFKIHPSFNGDTLVRVVRGERTEIWGYVTGQKERGQYQSPTVIHRRDLSADEWSSLVAVIDAAQFWDLPIEDKSRRGLDGEIWDIEGWRKGQSHRISRWSPNDEMVLGLRKAFLGLAAMKQTT